MLKRDRARARALCFQFEYDLRAQSAKAERAINFFCVDVQLFDGSAAPRPRLRARGARWQLAFAVCARFDFFAFLFF